MCLFSLPEIHEEKEVTEKWERYWSDNGERLIWSSWIEKYSDFINPSHQTMCAQQNFGDKDDELDEETFASNENALTIETQAPNNETEIVVSKCSPATSSIAAPHDINEETMQSDGALKEMMDSLALPRCDSVSSSIPLTVGTTDSMTNVTQITLSSYGFCSSRISSELSESTPSSLSPPSHFDDCDETKIELIHDEDTIEQHWFV